MRYVILADIHSNLIALEAVLRDLKRRGGFDRLWCLGDTVGYGPWPGECIDLLRTLDHAAVAGNHDWAAVDKTSLDPFNAEAAAACRWNAGRLEERHRSYLASLPQVAVEGEFTLVHGSPQDPLWEYVLDVRAAEHSFDALTTPHCLVGHAHLPLLFLRGLQDGPARMVVPQPGEPLALDGGRWLFNPGAVGQPRDGDPRASYALYDAEARTFSLYRMEYDVAAVQREMARVGLPRRMAQRLGQGW